MRDSMMDEQDIGTLAIEVQINELNRTLKIGDLTEKERRLVTNGILHLQMELLKQKGNPSLVELAGFHSQMLPILESVHLTTFEGKQCVMAIISIFLPERLLPEDVETIKFIAQDLPVEYCTPGSRVGLLLKEGKPIE